VAAIGLLLAMWGTRALVALSPANISRLKMPGVRGQSVIFLPGGYRADERAFGPGSAMQASTVNLSDTLKECGRGASRWNSL